MLTALVLLLAAPDPATSTAALAEPAMSYVCKGEGNRRLGEPGPFADRGGAFDDGVTVELDGRGGARIRIPRAMVPPLHGGGAGGWWTVGNLRVDRAEIAGTVSFNFLDKAHFILDRGLGVIDLAANLGRFVGKCETGEPG